jgi:hypothetical protein
MTRRQVASTRGYYQANENVLGEGFCVIVQSCKPMKPNEVIFAKLPELPPRCMLEQKIVGYGDRDGVWFELDKNDDER